jgi:hypothetical protein
VPPAQALRSGARAGIVGAKDVAVTNKQDGDDIMSISVNLAKKLDKAYENKSIEEVLDAPVSALAGLTAEHAKQLEAALGIKTVRDLGSNKFFAVAGVLVALSRHVDG